MVSRVKLVMGVFLCLVACGVLVAEASAETSKVRTANAEQILTLSDEDEEMVVLDTRSTADYKKGHIRWSENVTPKQFSAAFFKNKVPSKNTVVVFYGNKNSRSAALGAQLAAKAGYTDVYWLKGGWQEWQAKGLRLDQ